MSQPVLRRRTIPRLHIASSGATGKCALPGFLKASQAIPMTPAPIMGPHDALEEAILRGQLWHPGSDPVEIDAFDADQDVLSVIVEESDGTLRLDVEERRGGVQILANGLPMAVVSTNGTGCSLSDIRILKPRI